LSSSTRSSDWTRFERPAATTGPDVGGTAQFTAHPKEVTDMAIGAGILIAYVMISAIVRVIIKIRKSRNSNGHRSRP
jgi:hypothetical protein